MFCERILGVKMWKQNLCEIFRLFETTFKGWKELLGKIMHRNRRNCVSPLPYICAYFRSMT
jgi:hypothetical protein